MRPDVEQLFSAIESNDIALVTSLVARGVNVDARGADGWTPLLEAAKGTAEIASILLSHGADPNLSSHQGYTPLMRAAGHGCDEIVKLLISAGARLDAVDNSGQSALDIAYTERFLGAAGILEEALRKLRREAAAAPVERAPAPSVPSQNGPGLTSSIRVVPIFISSTFRDMHAERDLLRDVILPELQERLDGRRVLLELVDLRWGVDTTESETLRKNLRVLEVCFAEIERSRPYFISLLGDRYGWIPPQHAVEDAAKEAGLKTPPTGFSLTELEILFFLERSDQASRFFCYLRDPLPYQELISSGNMTREKAATYANEFLPEPMRTEVLKRRENLKRRLQEHGRTARYTAQWNPEKQAVEGLQSWKNCVFDDLWTAIDEETRSWADTVPRTWQETESRAIERYLATAAAQSEIRKPELESLIDFATRPGSHEGQWASGVLAEPGGGKSTFLASLCRRLAEKNVCVFSQFVGLGPKSISVLAMYQRWTQELCALEGKDQATEPDLAPDEAVRRFWRMLRTASVDRRIVLVIDGVEGFTSEDRLDWYGTMSADCPSNVRVVLSALPSSASMLEHRSGLAIHELTALDAVDAESIASSICKKYHRQFPRSLLSGILAIRRADGKPAIQNARWLSVAMEELNLLGREEFEGAESAPGGTDEGRLQQLLESTVRGFPSTVEELYKRAHARAARLDPEGAPLFAKLLACARHGLGNADLQFLLGTITGTPGDAARVAFLRRIFRAHLQTAGTGLFEFIDKRFAASITDYYRPTEAEQASLHKAIADYLGGLPEANPLRAQELMYHLLKANQADRAAKLWAQTFAQGKATENWLPAKWATLTVGDEVASRGSGGLSWLTSLLRSPSLSPIEVRDILESFSDTLSVTLLPRLSLPEKKLLYKALSDMFASLPREAETDGRRLKAHLATQLEAGKIDLAAGSLQDALRMFEDALETAGALRRLVPSSIDAIQGEAMAQEQRGRTLAALGKIDEAASAFQDAIAAQQNAPTSGERNRQIAHCLIYLGETHSAARRFDQALECFQEAYQKARGAALDVERSDYELTMSLAREREGDLRLKLDDLAGAIAAYSEVRKIRKKLLDLSPTELAIFNEAVSSEKLGEVLARQSKFREAREAYNSAQATYKSLAASDPANITWARAVATVTGMIGDLESQQGHMLGAKAAYNEQIQVLETARKNAPDNKDVLRSYMAALIDLGEVHLHFKEYEMAEKTLIRAVELAEALRNQCRTNATAVRDLVVAHVKLAIFYTERGKYGSAVSKYRKSIELIDEGLNLAPGDRRMRLDKAGFLWNMGTALQELHKPEDAVACLRQSYTLHRALATEGPLPSPQDQMFAILRRMFASG
jgi:tetratricopeptide (TPR) repeat protein